MAFCPGGEGASQLTSSKDAQHVCRVERDAVGSSSGKAHCAVGKTRDETVSDKNAFAMTTRRRPRHLFSS